MFGRLLPHFSRVVASVATVTLASTAVSFSIKNPISYADAEVGSGGGIIDDYIQESNSLPSGFRMGKLPFAGAHLTSSTCGVHSTSKSIDKEESSVVAFNLEEYMRARRAEEADRDPVPDG